jgi:hypothetical protein
VKPRSLILAAAAATVLVGSAFQASPAEAQTRTAVRVAPRRTVVVSAYYYRPLYYDPFWYGYDPFWYGARYQYPPFGYYGYPRYYDLSSSLRLQVTPRETEVFLDGYYAGTVDDFDGVFQRLNVEPGDHDIELYLPGHRLEHKKVYLQPGRTSSIKLAMQPLAAGEPEPVRPAGNAGPPSSRRPTTDRRRYPGDPSRDPRRPDDAIRDVPRDADSTYGSVSLRVQPGDAVITIDGEEWEGPQNDERLVVQLSAGRHVIVVQKDGFRRYTTEVNVRPGETATVNVALSPQ